MITAAPLREQTPQINWQQQLREAYRKPRDLLEALSLNPLDAPFDIDSHAEFAMLVPRPFAALMRPGDWQDPLLRQVLPLQKEHIVDPAYTADPLAEAASNVVPGLIHKYHGRVLMITNGHCAVNCRYCFRREFPYNDNRAHGDGFAAALDYVRADSSIREVILSGGDPLASTDQFLSPLMRSLAGIAHVQRLRIHSRLPVVIPERISQSLLATLALAGKQTVLVTHCNHPQEIGDGLRTAVALLKSADITVLNQSVLLRDVNDCAETLCNLSEQLFAAGVIPYYLHLLDKVKGSQHFDVSEAEALLLHRQMQSRLAGFLVPKLVQEEAGMANKTLLPRG